MITWIVCACECPHACVCTCVHAYVAHIFSSFVWNYCVCTDHGDPCKQVYTYVIAITSMYCTLYIQYNKHFTHVQMYKPSICST